MKKNKLTMRIQVYFKDELLIDYKNNNKNHNKIPKTFEILSTKLGCLKCKSDSLVERDGYTPAVDCFCCFHDCHHTVEVKSILAEGSQKDAFKNRPFVVKVGSVRTYFRVDKKNKSFVLFWYNIIEKRDNFVVIQIKNCLSFDMEELIDGVNCSTEIVLQRKKTKLKPRMNLKIFPESCKIKVLSLKDFKYNLSHGSTRQNKVIVDSMIRNQLKKKNIYK